MSRICVEEGNRKGLRVLIAENVPSYNRGESAILQGIVKAFRHAGLEILDLAVLSRNFQEDSFWYRGIARMIDWECTSRWELLKKILYMFICGICYKISKRTAITLFRGKFWDAFIHSDLILVGHDNALAGGSHVLWAISVCKFAQLAKKPIVIIAGSVKRSKYGDWPVRYLLNHVDLITLRDSASYEYCSGLNLSNSNVHLVADTAFLLDPVSKAEALSILQKCGVPNARPIIGVTLSRHSTVFRHAFELYGSDYPATENARVDLHAAIVAQALDLVIEKLDASVVFLPHCTGYKAFPSLDDRMVARRVGQAMRHSNRFFLMEDEYSASQLKAVIGELDMLVGERMHSVINALAMTVSALCISFPSDPRIGMIGKMLGISDNVYDIRGLRADTLAQKILNVWAQRLEMHQLLEREMIPYIKQEAFRSGELIAKVVQGK